MWKKDAESDDMARERTDATPSRPSTPGGARGPSERGAIGRSITIRGEVTGDEDLLIQGRVEGSVDLQQHAVTVGPEGDVKASIRGRIVTVEGTVHGDLTAQEQIILRSSARVQGDLSAPRVVIEDGASFRGGVDMGDPPAGGRRGQRPLPGGVATPSPDQVHTNDAPDPNEKLEQGKGSGAPRPQVAK
jgi:cytoskeletal protein CcmA (bactofilin family)